MLMIGGKGVLWEGRHSWAQDQARVVVSGCGPLSPPSPLALQNAPELCPHNGVGILPLRDSRFFPSSAYSCSHHQTLPIILSQHQRNGWIPQQNPLWKSSNSEKKKKEKRGGSTTGILFLQSSEHPLQVSGCSQIPIIPSRPQYHTLYSHNKVSCCHLMGLFFLLSRYFDYQVKYTIKHL